MCVCYLASPSLDPAWHSLFMGLRAYVCACISCLTVCCMCILFLRAYVCRLRHHVANQATRCPQASLEGRPALAAMQLQAVALLRAERYTREWIFSRSRAAEK